ncbi:hypothetical protein [Arundinibacter roseus]|uniref:DUF4369 domain-containing protein n=1 Tax=Arundinibacter roseus TaxID=2070510 RepID=A0A4R4K3B6_9BACT|nr:hypothetical protein [Arundinibacter roseus]TDB61820.1 hypothetical protein EZE20_18925 [Arundinibacter roseus]
MKKLLFFVIVFTASQLLYAQTEIAYDSTTDVHRYAIQAQLYDYRSNNEQNSYRTVSIKGSPFLYKSWQTGTIPLANNRSLTLPLNYNILEDYLFISMIDGEKQVFPETFTILDKTFVRINNQYYEAVYLGQTKLLRKYRARLDAVEKNGYNEALKYDYEYIKSEDLYIQTARRALQPVKLTEKSLLSRLSHHPSARVIVREQNLNLRSEKDVVTLLSTLEQ